MQTVLTWFENKEEEQKLSEFLQKNNYRCINCTSKKHFDDLLNTSLAQINLIILDLDLKETDAILTCNEVKTQHTPHLPFVIIISSQAEEFTQVTALDMGADDYIFKSVKPQLILKRIQAILSRKHASNTTAANSQSNFHIDTEKYQVIVNGNTYVLPRKEFELLNLFNSAPNKIFSREEIATILWNEERIAKQRTIDVHIRNIRKIVGKDLIKTLKGLGYGLNKAAI